MNTAEEKLEPANNQGQALAYQPTQRNTCAGKEAFLKTDSAIIALSDVSSIDCSNIKYLRVKVLTKTGFIYEATDINALELVLQTRPSALEGKGLKGAKFVWALHNLFAHPAMQILAFFGLYKWAFWVHDATVPRKLRKKNSTT